MGKVKTAEYYSAQTTRVYYQLREGDGRFHSPVPLELAGTMEQMATLVATATVPQAVWRTFTATDEKGVSKIISFLVDDIAYAVEVDASTMRIYYSEGGDVLKAYDVVITAENFETVMSSTYVDEGTPNVGIVLPELLNNPQWLGWGSATMMWDMNDATDVVSVSSVLLPLPLVEGDGWTFVEGWGNFLNISDTVMESIVDEDDYDVDDDNTYPFVVTFSTPAGDRTVEVDVEYNPTPEPAYIMNSDSTGYYSGDNDVRFFLVKNDAVDVDSILCSETGEDIPEGMYTVELLDDDDDNSFYEDEDDDYDGYDMVVTIKKEYIESVMEGDDDDDDEDNVDLLNLLFSFDYGGEVGDSIIGYIERT